MRFMKKRYLNNEGFAIVLALIFVFIITSLLVINYTDHLKLKRVNLALKQIEINLLDENKLFNNIQKILNEDLDFSLIDNQCSLDSSQLNCFLNNGIKINIWLDIEKKIIIAYNYEVRR